MSSRVRRRNRPHLIILRGLPGSGKTRLAWEILAEYGYTGVILSTDDYFIDEDGDYNFYYHQLPWAHEWNEERAKRAMEDQENPVIIDNTNIQRRHMKPYVQMGLDNGYYIQFETTPDTFDLSVDVLHRRANCGIPKWVMSKMKRNYEPAETIYDVLHA